MWCMACTLSIFLFLVQTWYLVKTLTFFNKTLENTDKHEEKCNLLQSYHQGEPVLRFSMYVKQTIFLLKMVAGYIFYFIISFKKWIVYCEYISKS